MKFIYQTATMTYTDENVTSVVGSGEDVLIFTTDYGAHHKYLISGKIMKRYELTSSFSRTIAIRNWRVSS